MEETDSKRASVEHDAISLSSMSCKGAKIDASETGQGADTEFNADKVDVQNADVASTAADSVDQGHSRNQSSTSTASLTRGNGNYEVHPRPSKASETERLGFFADLLLASAPRLLRIADNVSRSPTKTLKKVMPISEQRHPGKTGVNHNEDIRPPESITQEEERSQLPPSPDAAQSIQAGAEDGYLKGFPLHFLILGLCLVVFLISIDRTIITTPVFGRVYTLFGVGATVGPLIGGVFTDLVTWRWCFWLNLPVGAVTIIVMILVYNPRPNEHTKRTFFSRLINLDLIGNFILLGAAVMLFVALEYTTAGEAWGSPKVIGLLCGFGGAAVLFIIWLHWKQDGALIPPAIVKQRTVAASCCMAFFTYGALLIHTYFLPIWFQAIVGDSAIMSGVKMIPYFVANAVFSLFSGIFVSVVGYFAPPAIIGSAIGTVGCGIFSLFHPGMSTGMWVGFEILASTGFGMSIQQGFTAVQTVLSQEEMAVGTAAVVACQSLGGAIFISVGNSVFQSRLRTLVEGDTVPGVDLEAIIAAGAVAFRKMVTAEELQLVLPAYSGTQYFEEIM
ncbi:hypothetical protein SLS62_006862 [Diatrype stigma]|uniref:Uncharacterized protein n=1 Tax=Diatrype stigma TaxID=117547 RepID=A0AAN9V0C4_9PEZI